MITYEKLQLFILWIYETTHFQQSYNIIDSAMVAIAQLISSRRTVH